MLFDSILSNQYADLLNVADLNANKYLTADPYPHIVFKNFFNEDFLNRVVDEFPDLSTKETVSHNNPREKKYGSQGERYFGPETKLFLNYINSEPFLNFLQGITGIEERLIPDPYFKGGGQHEIKSGGLLKIHSDFNKHHFLKLDRRVNALIYLNKDWKEEYGGHFELWNRDMTKCVQRVLPEFNTIVIFSTTDYSYHGHPDPLNCPVDRSRKSLATFYYSNGRPKHEIDEKLTDHGSLFKKRKGNINDKRDFSLRNPARVKEVIAEFVPPILIKMKSKIF